MTDRHERNVEIIRQLERDANAYAASYEADVAEFQRLYRLERMQDIVLDLAERIEESGDEARLAELGVYVREEDDGRLLLRQFHRTFEVRPRDDMSIVVDGRILTPDRDCPVLDAPLYDEVMTRAFAWAREANRESPSRYFE